MSKQLTMPLLSGWTEHITTDGRSRHGACYGQLVLRVYEYPEEFRWYVNDWDEEYDRGVTGTLAEAKQAAEDAARKVEL